MVITNIPMLTLPLTEPLDIVGTVVTMTPILLDSLQATQVPDMLDMEVIVTPMLLLKL